MIFEEKVRTGAKDLEKGNSLGNRAILEYFENIASRHADSLGYGINSMPLTHLSWLLLDWYVRVYHRPSAYRAHVVARDKACIRLPRL